MKTLCKLLAFAVFAAGFYYFIFYRSPVEKKLEKLTAAAQKQDVVSQRELGRLYEKGEGKIPANAEQAIYWYGQAAINRDTEAAFLLAKLYLEGKVVSQDKEEGSSYMLLSAQENYAPAQYEIGHFYQEGLFGFPQHKGQSLLWWMKAAENNYPEAQKALALESELNPEAVARAEKTAALLQKALQGDTQAQLEAGLAYRDGTGVAPDAVEAVRLFSEAWEKGKLAQAAYELGALYRDGKGVEKNDDKALSYFNEAASLKNPDAQNELGNRAYVNEKYEDAFAWFSNAAVAGHPRAQYMTGFMLMQGQGTNRYVPLATEYFEKAALQEDSLAQYVLGQIFWKGLGVPTDKKKGRKWLEQAAANGNPAAEAFLESIK